MERWERKAFDFARYWHKGQLDDEDKLYFEAHILPVTHLVKILTEDQATITAAYLHDTLEDTAVKYALIEKEFGAEVAELVHELTHDGQKDEYGYYFPRLKSQKAILVKLCDRASNISRMSAWPEIRQLQYLSKSHFWKDGSDRV